MRQTTNFEKLYFLAHFNIVRIFLPILLLSNIPWGHIQMPVGSHPFKLYSYDN